MNAENIEAWCCAECGLPYWEYEGAVECCQDPPAKKEAYACEQCRAVYRDKTEADECCTCDEGSDKGECYRCRCGCEEFKRPAKHLPYYSCNNCGAIHVIRKNTDGGA